MIRTFLLTYAVPAVFSIIVTDPPPAAIQYKYSYDIADPATGDTKSQHEVRQGGIVTGQYSVVDPDGTKRIVDYNVHPDKGFTAVVRTEPVSIQPSVTPTKNYVIPLRNPVEIGRQYANAAPKFVYTSVEAPEGHMNFIPVPYQKSNFERESIYFTPANEIATNKVSFKQGHYFIPAHRK